MGKRDGEWEDWEGEEVIYRVTFEIEDKIRTEIELKRLMEFRNRDSDPEVKNIVVELING